MTPTGAPFSPARNSIGAEQGVTGLLYGASAVGYGPKRRSVTFRRVEVADSVKLRGHRPGVAAVVSNDPRARCCEPPPFPCNRDVSANSVTADPPNWTYSGWPVTAPFRPLQEAG